MEASGEKNIWLIGEVCSSFPDGIVTIRDALRVYFYYRVVLLKQRKESVNYVAKDLIAHWSKNGTHTIEAQDIVRKVNKVLERHDLYKKNMHRLTPTQRYNEQKFIDLLNEKFDIFPKENYRYDRKKKLESEVQEKAKSEQPLAKIERVHQSDEDVNMNVDMSDEDEKLTWQSKIYDDSDFEMNLPKYYRSKLSCNESVTKQSGVIQKIVDSPEVSSALDRTGISAPKFTLLCAVMAGAIGEDINECKLSTSTCYRRRKVHRNRIVTTIKDDYISSAKSNLVLHWDGKKLQDSTNDDVALRKKKVERLAVVVSGIEGQKIITIAKTEHGTGIAIADTAYEHVSEWTLVDRIVAVCADTTASNTGPENGAVVLFQKLMNRNLLYFACRHHVDELTIGAVFVGLFGESTGSSPQLFEHFRANWPIVNKASFKPLDVKNFKPNTYIRLQRDDVIQYIRTVLHNKKRDLKADYLEMLELCLIVLGHPIPKYNFHVPHACSHSRWMAKIIYSMKIYLFRHQLNLSKSDVTNLKNICLFICLIYTKHWMQNSIASNAPHNDLQLMKDLKRYEVINKKVANLAIDKFRNHLWYLGSELVILALFSNKVADVVKRRMFEKMKNLDNGKWTTRKWRLLDSSDIFEKDLDDFVDSSSMSALKSLKIDIQFMFENDVSDWKNLDSYKSAKTLVDSLQVVHDCAERTLKLMTDFNESLTSKEPEMQRAIQVIEDNRKRIPSTKKSVLVDCQKHSFE